MKLIKICMHRKIVFKAIQWTSISYFNSREPKRGQMHKLNVYLKYPIAPLLKQINGMYLE